MLNIFLSELSMQLFTTSLILPGFLKFQSLSPLHSSSMVSLANLLNSLHVQSNTYQIYVSNPDQ